MNIEAKAGMPCGANGGVLPKALGPCGALPGLSGCGCGMGSSGMGMPGMGGLDKGKEGEGDEVQQQVMLQMQMQMQMMMMGAMMGSMLGEGDDKDKDKKSKKRKKDKQNETDDGLPPGSSNDMSHPSYRPQEMEPIPGVTDRRFEGRITMWLEAGG